MSVADWEISDVPSFNSREAIRGQDPFALIKIIPIMQSDLLNQDINI